MEIWNSCLNLELNQTNHKIYFLYTLYPLQVAIARCNFGPLRKPRYKHHRKGIQKAVDGVGAVFPRTHKRILLEKETDPSLHGVTNTTSGSTFSFTEMGFNTSTHKGTPDQIVGKSAETMAHELFVHARHDLNNNKAKQPQTSAAHDHDQMHEPGHRDEFLGVARNTFNQMDNAQQKSAFAHEYHSDVFSEISGSGATTDEKQERKAWARSRRDSMLDAIQHPYSHSWTGQGDTQRHLQRRMRTIRAQMGYDDD